MLTNQEFHILLNQIKSAESIEDLVTVSKRCTRLYLDKLLTVNGYNSVCRMITERIGTQA